MFGHFSTLCNKGLKSTKLVKKAMQLQQRSYRYVDLENTLVQITGAIQEPSNIAYLLRFLRRFFDS